MLKSIELIDADDEIENDWFCVAEILQSSIPLDAVEGIFLCQK